MTATEAKLHALRQRLLRPVDAASLAAFRIGFGALMLVAVLRFFAHGWIAEYFLQPTHFFKYWGFEWVRPWPGPFMYVHFAAMALCALGVLLGYRYRASVLGFGTLFAYAHLIDKTNYLNHYYLVMCLCGLMALLPLHACWSLDARRRAELAQQWLPAWMLWALRAQLAVVYSFGGIAKLKPDWLLTAQPLSIWLGRHTDLPVLGPLFAQPWTAHVMSWAGAAFDLSIVPLLLMRRTRPFAYVAVATFHLLTARLFQLGLFPYIMMFGSLLFLSPSWPRQLLARLGLQRRASAAPPEVVLSTRASWLWPALSLYFALQFSLPLRHWLYPGNVCWTEQGYRFSWNVMLMEKNGSVDFRVVEPSSGRTFRVSPLDYFTRYQTKMMAPQPDMVLQAAHIVAEDFRARGVVAPVVYADAFASLNGRAMQRLIDPRADLARQADDLSNKPWILPMKPSQEGQASLAWSPE
jgi:vitamin K-dependent gamma-carboxylase